MIEAVIIFFLALASVSAVAACTAKNAKRVLWGLLTTTIGIGIAVELAIKGYLGVLVLSVFLVTDVVLYLFLRTQVLVPSDMPDSGKTDVFYRVSMLWVVFCSCLAGAFGIFSTEFHEFSTFDSSLRMAALYDKLWGNDWILILAMLLSLSVLVVGGFFLIRKGEE